MNLLQVEMVTLIFKGAFIKEATFGDYNWDTENEAKQIELTLGLDYAVLNF